jgi:capsular exopolysaccharide synthesis family protein
MEGEEIADAVQMLPGIPGLSILPGGHHPPNPAELLTSVQFQELIEALRVQYDFVLIDTPPLLAVTDPCVVAPRVDGVLLTVRIVKNGRPMAERARHMLATMGAKVLGVVVNGVRARRRGYEGYGYETYYTVSKYDDSSTSDHYYEDEEQAITSKPVEGESSPR